MAGVAVLDASILIAYLDASDRHHAAARQIVAGADSLAASVLTLSESAVHPARTGRLERWQQATDKLEVRSVTLPADCATFLATLRREHGLEMPNCCVLHTAGIVSADAIGTRDKDLAKAARSWGLETL